MAVCVCVSVGGGKVWGCCARGFVGGVVDLKPDSTGNGALAEMAKVLH